MLLTIIIPAYNETNNIQQTILELEQVLQKISAVHAFDFLIIDDHSDDHTFETVLNMKKENVRCLRLSKRSGSHTAIRSGLRYAKGDFVLCLSADGQDNPNILHAMIAKAEAGAHIVWGMRKLRKEAFAYMLFVSIFYGLLKLLTKTTLSIRHLANADFFLLSRDIVNAVNACQEKNTSLFGLLLWIGYAQDFVEYERRERRVGKSKWNFSSRLQLAKDWLIAFSGVPLALASYLGIFLAILGFLYALLVVYNYYNGQPQVGWSSTVIVILVLGGAQMTMLGVLGEYMWRTLDETRKRPLFFVEKRSWKPDEEE